MEVGAGKQVKLPEFTSFHIDRVWALLGEQFGFNTRQWKFRFADYREEMKIKRKDLDHDLVSDFYYFGNTVINPVLNQILGRNDVYPTFNNLIHFVATGKKKREPTKRVYDKGIDLRR